MAKKKRSKVDTTDRYAALYHVVYEHEGFEESAQNLFKLVRRAQELQPGKRRVMFLDIDGHRNDQDGFDADMVELQMEFLLGFLRPFLAEIHCPLGDARNPIEQENEIPEVLHIQSGADRDA